MKAFRACLGDFVGDLEQNLVGKIEDRELLTLVARQTGTLKKSGRLHRWILQIHAWTVLRVSLCRCCCSLVRT